MRSAPVSAMVTGSEQKACTASVWTSARGTADLTASAILRTGCRAPVSLLAAITDTTAVRSLIASSTSSGATTPVGPTGTTTAWRPIRATKRAAASTASCSTAVTTACPPRVGDNAAPPMARLSDSVPPLVNTTSRGRAAPTRAATRSRASSMAFLARRETAWTPEGLP